MAEQDRLLVVQARLRAGSLEQLRALQAMTGQSRSELIREAVSWLIARETARIARWEHIERQRVLDDERRAWAARVHSSGDEPPLNAR